jgi:hypothetical protein
MSSVATTQRRPRISTGTASVRLIAASLAAAAAIFGGLAVQMAHGKDPALGAGTSTAQTSGSGSSSGGSSTSGADRSSFQDQSGGSSGGVVTRAS